MGSTTKRDRTAKAVLEAAVAVFAEQGPTAGIAEVADAAGVGRATLYRYFASREALVDALVEYALEETLERLAAADLEHVDFAEGVARVVRALVATRSKYALLAQMVDHSDRTAAGTRLNDPIRAFLGRGIKEGAVCSDLSEEELIVIFSALCQAAAHLVSRNEAGIERGAAIASSVFLRGAGTRAP